MYNLVNIPNGKISYYSKGAGSPIILLNGFSGTFLHWSDEFISELQKHHKVYCLNYRGIGFSSALKNTLSISELAEDVSQFIQELNLGKVSLLGYSMGGYVAQEFAMHYAAMLSALYLVSTRTAGEKSVPTPPEIIKSMAPQELSVEERVQARLNLNFPLECHETLRPIQRKWVEHYALPECTLDLPMMDKQSRAIGEWNKSFANEKYHQYSKFNVPTFIFSGLKDLIIPYQNSIVLCSLIPNSRVTLFENGGHGLLGQFGKEIAEQIGV